MKKIIFAMISATMLIACADNGVSAPSEICYDKKLTYRDVNSPMYSQYADEWNEGNMAHSGGHLPCYWLRTELDTRVFCIRA